MNNKNLLEYLFEMKLNKNIIHIIEKYIPIKIYIVLLKYIKNGFNNYTSVFGVYTSYDLAHTSIMNDINIIYKKRNEHNFSHLEKHPFEHYENLNQTKFIGTRNYTEIHTTTHIKHESTKYIYEIQEQEIDNYPIYGYEFSIS